MENLVSYNDKLSKAFKLLLSGKVKLHKFLPSNRIIYTVIGNDGDLLILDKQLFCSCKDYYYRLLEKDNLYCIHLLALKIAYSISNFDKIDFHDHEYAYFLTLLLNSVN